MTQYLNRSFFEKEEPLDQGTLSSVVVESSAGIQDALLPLGLVSARTQNVATVLHVNGEGQVIRLNLVMSGKPWAKKMDAKRLFSGAPEGSKLVIQKLDVSGFEFPPGEHTSLWLSSTEFDWSVQKTNNRDQGSHTQDELEGFGIRDWSLRVHIEVNEDPSIATVRWVGVPIPVGELNSLPGDPKKVGYPSVALSNGEANMAGVPNIENQSATSVGIPFYPVMINEAAPSSSIVIPRDDDIINAMCEFWRSGNTVRNMRLDDWVNVTKGPGEPSSDRGIPVLTWPPAEPACARDEEADYSDPSEDEEEPALLSAAEMDRVEAERIAANARRELGFEERDATDKNGKNGAGKERRRILQKIDRLENQEIKKKDLTDPGEIHAAHHQAGPMITH